MMHSHAHHAWHDEVVMKMQQSFMQGWIKVEQRQVALDPIHPLHQQFVDKPATLCTVCPALGINVPACQCTRQLVLVVGL